MSDHKKREFAASSEADLGSTLTGVGRFRVNVFRQRGVVGLAIRRVRSEVPTFEELRLPPVLAKLADSPRGLVLVTGPTGTGKTTTIASMIGHINRTRRAHIVTIEDPIEVVHDDEHVDHPAAGDRHRHRLLRRRPQARDPSGPRRDLRRRDPRPRVRAVARSRRRRPGTSSSRTLHTVDCVETINRVLDLFPPQQHKELRTSFAGALRGIVSQRLVVRADGKGRVPCVEVLVDERPRSTTASSIPSATESILEVIARGRVLRHADLRPGARAPRARGSGEGHRCAARLHESARLRPRAAGRDAPAGARVQLDV